MTFVGFKVDDKGQCYDTKSNDLIEDCQVPLEVCEFLRTQGLNLQEEDCNEWTKYVNIKWLYVANDYLNGNTSLMTNILVEQITFM